MSTFFRASSDRKSSLAPSFGSTRRLLKKAAKGSNNSRTPSLETIDGVAATAAYIAALNDAWYDPDVLDLRRAMPFFLNSNNLTRAVFSQVHDYVQFSVALGRSLWPIQALGGTDSVKKFFRNARIVSVLDVSGLSLPPSLEVCSETCANSEGDVLDQEADDSMDNALSADLESPPSSPDLLTTLSLFESYSATSLYLHPTTASPYARPPAPLPPNTPPTPSQVAHIFSMSPSFSDSASHYTTSPSLDSRASSPPGFRIRSESPSLASARAFLFALMDTELDEDDYDEDDEEEVLTPVSVSEDQSAIAIGAATCRLYVSGSLRSLRSSVLSPALRASSPIARALSPFKRERASEDGSSRASVRRQECAVSKRKRIESWIGKVTDKVKIFGSMKSFSA